MTGDRSAWGYLRAMAKVCRFEYIHVELPALLLPVFICATGIGDILQWHVLFGILMFVFLYFSGFSINAYTDYEIDKKYDSQKPEIARAVDYLGKRNLKLFVGGKVVAALFMAIVVSILMQQLWAIVYWVAMAFTGLGYSSRPFAFKTRGVLSHALSLGMCAFFIPISFLCYIIAGEMRIDFIVFTLGFAMAMWGMTLGNQSNDYIEDRAEGVLSPSVRMGIPRAQSTTIALIALGIPVMIYGLFLRMQDYNFLYYLGLDEFQSLLVVSTIIVAAYSYPARRSWRMVQLSRGKDYDELKKIMPRVRACCVYPKWHGAVVGGLLVATGLMFGAALLAPTLDYSFEGELRFMGEPSVGVVPATQTTSRASISVAIENIGDMRDSGTVLLKIEAWTISDIVPYANITVIVPKRLIDKETWQFVTHLDIPSFTKTTFKFYLKIDTDRDGTFELTTDMHAIEVTPAKSRLGNF